LEEKETPQHGGATLARWHQRLGHVSQARIKELSRSEEVEGLRIEGSHEERSCKTCMEGKFVRFPFHPTGTRSRLPLELVHVDLVGPMQTLGRGGVKYFMTLVDDSTRMKWTLSLAKKSDAGRGIQSWAAQVENQSDHRIKAFRSDRGGEFLGEELQGWFKEQGIQHQLTQAYSPQSNGLAERSNRTLIEVARTLLLGAGLPPFLWPDAVRQAAVISNRVLTQVKGEEWVPLHRWTGHAVEVGMLRVFGCAAAVLIPKKFRVKMGPTAKWGIHLGVALGSKG
jgi:transposase InsO family protein